MPEVVRINPGDMRQIRLKHWRQNRALTIAELSEKSKVSKATIVKLEKPNHRTPNMSTVRKLAEALKITPAELWEPE